jgi:lipoprotein signal peptidase
MDQTTQERGKLQNFQRMRRLVLALIIAALVIALLFVRSAWGEEGHEFIEAIGIGTIAAGILGPCGARFISAAARPMRS